VPQKRQLKVHHKVTRLTVNLLTSSVVRFVVPAYCRALYNAKTDTSNVRPYLLTPSNPVLCILKRKYAVLQRRKNLPGALSFFPAKREILPNCAQISRMNRPIYNSPIMLNLCRGDLRCHNSVHNLVQLIRLQFARTALNSLLPLPNPPCCALFDRPSAVWPSSPAGKASASQTRRTTPAAPAPAASRDSRT
jgi:hypothetical protein